MLRPSFGFDEWKRASDGMERFSERRIGRRVGISSPVPFSGKIRMSPFFEIELTDAPEPGVVQFLDDRLYEFNAARTGFDDGRLLAILARDRHDRIVGGLYGWTWGGCCYVRTLWIDEPHRGRGLGRRLMKVAQREAIARGARQIVLDTHSFQAPGFYQRLGFEIVGSFPDYPRGHTQLFLIKKLPRRRASARTPRGRSSGRRRSSPAARAR